VEGLGEGVWVVKRDPDVAFYHPVRRGQVKCARSHECIHCGREICRNEYAWVKAMLMIEGKVREVQVTYSCCKAIR